MDFDFDFCVFATTCSNGWIFAPISALFRDAPLGACRSETQQRRTGELLLSLHRFCFWACCLEKGPFEYKHLVTFYIYVPCTSDQRLHVGRISPSLIHVCYFFQDLARSLCRDCGLVFACNAVNTPLFEP